MKKLENMLTAAGEIFVGLLFQLLLIPVIVAADAGECFPDLTEDQYPATCWIFGGFVAAVVFGVFTALCFVCPVLYFVPPMVWGILRYRELERCTPGWGNFAEGPFLVGVVGEKRFSREFLRRVENTLRWAIVGVVLVPGQIAIGLAGGMYVAERYGDNSQYPNSTMLLCMVTTVISTVAYALLVALAPAMLAITPVVCWLGMFFYETQLDLRLTLKTEGG